MDSSLLMNVMLTDDGSTLLAVRQGSDGSLELMSTPVTIIQDQSANTLQLLKSSSCNFVLNEVQINNILPNNTQQLSNLLSTDVTNLESQICQISSKQLQFQPEQITIDPTQRSPKLHTQESKAINDTPKKTPTLQLQPSKTSTHAKRIENISSKNIPEICLQSNEDIPTTYLEEEISEDACENVEENSSEKKKSGKSHGKSKKKSKTNNQPACLKCDICGQEFKKQYLMQKHLHDHAQEKPYHCPKCPASFNVPTNFTLHMATHTFSDPKCPECGKKFARVASLKTHMVIHEVDENLYCTDCDDKFETKAQLEAHLKLHNEKCSTDEHRKCKLCRKQFSQPAVYRQHLRDHYKLQTKFTKQTKWGIRHRTTYKCKICMKMFDKPSQLVRHIRVHTGEKPYKCNLCNRGFTQKGSVRIHMWQHNGVRPYSCNLCNATFSQKGNLNSHVERVHKAQEGSTIYRCMQCPCIFKKLGSLNGHMKRVHGGTRTEETLDREDEMAAPEEEMDIAGGKESQQVVDSTVPANEQMPESVFQPEADNTGVVTAENSQKFEDGFVVTDNTEQTALVTLLDKSNDPQGKYIKIKQRFVNNSRFYECNYCVKKFKKPSDLIRHLRIHTQEKPFKCKTCNRSFTLKSTMMTHEKIHKIAKKFPCRFCCASFKFQSEQADHEKFHKEQQKVEANENQQKVGRTKLGRRKKQCAPEVQNLMPEVVLKEPLVLTEAGDGMLHAQPKYRNDIAYGKGRPHKCYACPAAFMKLSHLKQHHRKHTGERPYMCHLCDRSFSTNSALKAHRRTHDFLKPHECSICGMTFSTLSSMKRHHITHTNKRPYMCPYCNKTFKSTVNCRKHMKLHKEEIAQQQLELKKRQQQSSNSIVNNIETITIAEPIIINNQQIFQPITANLQHNLNGQLQSIVGNKETSFLSNPQASQNLLETNLSTVENSNINSTQTSHASETDTITLANYPGDQTLTPENIRQLEETLNQQLFNIGLNVTPHSTNKSIENNINTLENREAPTLSIIYDDGKILESAMNTSINADNVFAQQFDNFDIGQVSLQADAQIMGISNPNAADLTNILQNQLSQTQSYTVQLVDNNVAINSVLNQNHVSNENQNNESLTGYVNQNQNNQNNKNSIMDNLHCHTCNLGEFNVDDLKEHLKTHQNKGYECTQCLSKFATNEELSEHVKVHENQETHKCYECHKEFLTTLQLREHIKEHVKHELKLKNLGVDDDVIDFESESNKEPANKRINICQYCSKSFRKPSDLIRHVRTHTGEKPYQCQHCDKSFAVKCTLDSHLKVHAGEKTYYCSVCNTMYATRGSLKVHMRLHTGDRPFTCEICNMTFRTSGHRKVHMISHTREPGSTSRKSKKGKTQSIEQPSGNIVQMVQVPNIFESQQNISQNQNVNTITINSVSDQVTLTSENSALSDSANLLALNENNQLVQLLLANGLVTIQTDDSMICPQPSATENVSENNFVKPQELQKEANQVVYTAELSNAIPATLNASDYQLNNCMVLQMGNVDSSVVSNSDDVNTLNEAKSFKNIKHKCDICGKGFAKPCQVERHKRTHTGERPFQCEICNKSFSQKSTLQMHQKYHKGDRPHACPHCERSFTQSGNLLTHLRRVHKLDPAETKRLPKEQQFVFYDPKLLQQSVDDTRNLSLDDISLIELLK